MWIFVYFVASFLSLSSLVISASWCVIDWWLTRSQSWRARENQNAEREGDSRDDEDSL
jgi:hypothetical protein